MVSSPIVIITMIDNPPNEVSDNSGNTAQEVSSLTKVVRNAGDHEIERWTNEKTIAYNVWMDLLTECTRIYWRVRTWLFVWNFDIYKDNQRHLISDRKIHQVVDGARFRSNSVGNKTRKYDFNAHDAVQKARHAYTHRSIYIYIYIYNTK